MKVIIAEKPSVARAIAQVVGATTNKIGYFLGNDYAVTWAYGHLVALAMPEAYGNTGFNRDRLPMLPKEFKLSVRQIKTDKGYKDDTTATKQLDIINKLFNRCQSIIVATDAGREGELIFRYIYEYLGCRKPFSRLWISSLTEKSIRNGMENLKSGDQYNNLYLSARARSQADWLIGINATQALTISASRGTYSLGRVQTPTLMMIYHRYMKNRQFKAEPYWKVKVQIDVNGISIPFTSKQQYHSKEQAEAVLCELSYCKSLTIKSVDTKKVVEAPPLLHDLTSLQKQMNMKYGFSAEKTLSIAQRLYEAQLITYPRTGSCYVDQDIAENICNTIEVLEDMYPQLAGVVLDSKNFPRCVDNSKITDHHAILPTENGHNGLDEDEHKVYQAISARMVEAFSVSCIKEVTTISAIGATTEFELCNTEIKQGGWRSLHEPQKQPDVLYIPEISNQDVFPLVGSSIVLGQTKATPLHTEASLLAEMETAGKDLENEAERLAMKDSGIGTPATRAAIIETLFNRNYIRREGKKLVPTDKGIAVCQVIEGKKIGDVQMTGMWESALATIERGEMCAETFNEGIKVLTTQITRELLNCQIQHSSISNITCPKCGKHKILIFDKVAKCESAECGLIIYRNKLGKTLTERDLTDLLTLGKTELIKGFISKAGKAFSAHLILDQEFHVLVEFPKQN